MIENMFKQIDKFEYIERNNELIFRHALGDDRFAEPKKRNPKRKKYCIWFTIIWTVVVFLPALFCFFSEIGSVRMTACVLLVGISGLYFAYGILVEPNFDFSHKKYYSLKVNREGISEVWDFPEGKFEKTVLWSELKYYGTVHAKVYHFDYNRLHSYYNDDYVVFSSETTDESEFKKIITDVLCAREKGDLKLKDIEHTIFLRPDEYGTYYTETCKMIDNFLIRNKIELPAMKE